jgi:hypothetical protein
MNAMLVLDRDKKEKKGRWRKEVPTSKDILMRGVIGVTVCSARFQLLRTYRTVVFLKVAADTLIVAVEELKR